jgi:hypothetical protein
MDGAGQFTVQFDINRPAPFGGMDSPSAPQARVSWRTAGNSVDRIFSVNNGTEISGVGQTVSVELFDGADVNDFGAVNEGVQYVGSILIAKGTRPSGSLATFSPPDQFRLIPPAGVETFPVPPGATQVFITCTSGLAVPFPVKVGIIGASVLFLEYNLDNQKPMWVPLPADALTVRVANTFTDPVNVGILFSIDG